MREGLKASSVNDVWRPSTSSNERLIIIDFFLRARSFSSISIEYKTVDFTKYMSNDVYFKSDLLFYCFNAREVFLLCHLSRGITFVTEKLIFFISWNLIRLKSYF